MLLLEVWATERSTALSTQRGQLMYRVIALGLGGLLVALGVVWFFSSLLDGLALAALGRTDLSPLSKMYLGDDISMLVAGLSLTGIALAAFGLVDWPQGNDKIPPAAPKAN